VQPRRQSTEHRQDQWSYRWAEIVVALNNDLVGDEPYRCTNEDKLMSLDAVIAPTRYPQSAGIGTTAVGASPTPQTIGSVPGSFTVPSLQRVMPARRIGSDSRSRRPHHMHEPARRHSVWIMSTARFGHRNNADAERVPKNLPRRDAPPASDVHSKTAPAPSFL